MPRFKFSKLVSTAGLAASITGAALAQGPAAPPSRASEVMARAVRAESEHRFDAAMAGYYEILMEHPRDPAMAQARLSLAGLLALSGRLPSALLEANGAMAASAGEAQRDAAHRATLLTRRVRAQTGATLLPTVGKLEIAGLPSLDEPSSLVFDRAGGFVIVDRGAGRAFQVAAGGASMSAIAGQDITAVFPTAAGNLMSSKNGVTRGSSVPGAWIGTWGGKARAVKKVESFAPLSNGDVLVVDKDYDGVLTCVVAKGSCLP
jgi:hypothetical protein